MMNIVTYYSKYERYFHILIALFFFVLYLILIMSLSNTINSNRGMRIYIVGNIIKFKYERII